MKTTMRMTRWLLIVVLAMSAAATMAQLNQNPTQTVCLGNQDYNVDPNPGATFNWTLSGGGTITAGAGTNAITVTWDTPGGPYTLSVSTTLNGCTGPAKSVDVTVVEAPVGPTLLAMTPVGPAVCEGTDVSATFNPGTGGIGCSDEFEYSYDGLGVWVAYVEGTPITTVTHTLVEIRGRRTGCNATLGCNETPWVILATWTVNTALPVSVIITASVDPVCAGVMVTYTANVTNGGLTPTYEWHVNGGPVMGTLVTFDYTPLAGDVITCVVLSSETCATTNPATGTFTPVVNPVPTTSDIWHN